MISVKKAATQYGINDALRALIALESRKIKLKNNIFQVSLKNK